jgi:hypothetical protein
MVGKGRCYRITVAPLVTALALVGRRVGTRIVPPPAPSPDGEATAFSNANSPVMYEISTIRHTA